ncbi:MAG: hypothetical protein ABI268_10700, partial [Rhodanobacter sp.]
TASTSDFVQVTVPVDLMWIARYERNYMSIIDVDYVTDMTRLQVYQVLKQAPPPDCNMSNYPAAPGIPGAGGSEWTANGCGVGAFTTAFASIGLYAKYRGLYSGDMNRPVKGNPSINFGSACNKHDELYTSGNTKAFADQAFQRRLGVACDIALSDKSSCNAFKVTYVSTVKDHAQDAYDADQKELKCAAWGDSMKKSGCV